MITNSLYSAKINCVIKAIKNLILVLNLVNNLNSDEIEIIKKEIEKIDTFDISLLSGLLK